MLRQLVAVAIVAALPLTLTGPASADPLPAPPDLCDHLPQLCTPTTEPTLEDQYLSGKGRGDCEQLIHDTGLGTVKVTTCVERGSFATIFNSPGSNDLQPMDKARAFTCIESDPDDPMLGNWSVSPVKTKVFKKNGTKITVGSSKLTNGCYGFGWKSVLTGRENIYATTNKLTIYATDSTNTVGTYQSLGIVQTAVVDSDVIRLAPPGA